MLRPWLFDVTAAIELLRRVPRTARPLPVMAWARAYGMIPGPGSRPHSVRLIGPGPGFDPDYAMTTDLDGPVIIASITVVGAPPAPLLIDGYALPDTVRAEILTTDAPEPGRRCRPLSSTRGSTARSTAVGGHRWASAADLRKRVGGR